jgi:hypothetical protein
MDASLEWATPVLFMRSQDGMLFNLRRTVTPVTPLIKTDENVPKPASSVPADNALPTPREEAHRIARQRASAERMEREKQAAIEMARPKPANPPAQKLSPPLSRQATPPQPTTAPGPQSRPFPTWLFILGGVVIFFIVVAVVFSQIIGPGIAPPGPTVLNTEDTTGQIAPAPTTTDIPTSLPADTLVPPTSEPPTSEPSPRPGIVAIGPSDPADFVVFYFDTIIRDKNYDLGWSLVTEEYKTINDLKKASYDDTWFKTESWEPSNLTEQYISPTRAIVSLTATFHYTSGRSWTPDPGLKYCMVRDESRNTWMIDTKRNCGIQ